MGANVISVLVKPFISNAKIVWGVRASTMEFKNYHWTQWVTHKIERLLSKFADLIITNSQAGCRLAIQNGFPSHKTAFIPNGINTDHFKPNNKSRIEIRSRWGVTDNEALIGVVARLNPVKDHKNFITAASLLTSTKNGGDFRFICIGDGPEKYKKMLQQHAITLGINNKIIWAGAHKNMNDVYNGIDILCLSSSSEGFPNVIAEAMSCNTVCVATNVGDAALIIGGSGITVPPSSPANLSEGILKVINGKEYKLNDLQRNRILSEFSLNRLIDKTEKSLMKLL
jgi:glycosyltransferase involved in cell wall biosynthesis